MMDQNLIIVDEYVQSLGSRCAQRGEKLEQILADYLQILREIREEALVEGKTASSLGIFIDCVSLLRDQLGILSDNADRDCRSYINDINTADDYLF